MLEAVPGPSSPMRTGCAVCAGANDANGAASAVAPSVMTSLRRLNIAFLRQSAIMPNDASAGLFRHRQVASGLAGIRR
ncbi:MAG: hypothetical protein IPI73_25000 [Betaproteobacteria bacterium]|nr:hypothetical protein [Betaproteobacteria bacterium]